MTQPRCFDNAIEAVLDNEAATAFVAAKSIVEKPILPTNTPFAGKAGELWKQLKAFATFAVAKGLGQGTDKYHVACWDGRPRIGPRGEIDPINKQRHGEESHGSPRWRTGANSIPHAGVRNRQGVRDLNDIICFKCGKADHYADKCSSIVNNERGFNYMATLKGNSKINKSNKFPKDKQSHKEKEK